MNYKKIYKNIIKKAQTREIEHNINPPSDVYFEQHHIIPKCMGGSNNITNLVKLTPEEHFVCHQLLVKIYPKNKKISLAAIMMTGDTKKRNKRNNKCYGWLKRRYSQSLKGRKSKYTTLICKFCGLSYEVSAYYKNISTFCSRLCKIAYQSRNCKTIVCPGCNKEIKQKLADQQYCNKACCDSHGRKTISCKHCGKNFIIKKHLYGSVKYCSNLCKSQHTNTTIKCLFCKKERTVNNSLVSKFCSRECHYKAKKAKMIF
jgi:hypothetical protein